MRRVVLLAAVVAMAGAVAVAEAAPTASLSAKVSPKPVLLNHSVSVRGKLSTGKSGVGVVLETQRFPFAGAFQNTASTTTGAGGTYGFNFKPTLATRVRVRLASDPSVKSKTPTAYVIADYSHVTCSIRSSSGKNYSCNNPKGASGDLTIHLSFHRIYPASAYNAESAKNVYVYFNQRNSTKQPDHDLLRKTVKQTKLGGNKTAVNVSYFFHTPTTAWSYHLATCVKFTEAADGVGLPGHHGCGDQSVGHKQATSYTFG